MKRSVSSVLAERIRQRRAVTPSKFSVRYVKFTPEEMAYDIPDDTSHFVPVGRGPGAIFAKPPRELLRYWKRQLADDAGYARLEGDVRKAFPDDRLVNQTLRKVIELQSMRQRAKLKKSA